ncbi:MAG: transposase [Blastocatellia bacterium]|nr:transposase [Blastocatellia bacterium]
MKATATVKVKLSIRDEDIPTLESTQAAYTKALNETSKVAFDTGVINAVALHHFTYKAMREATGLPANLVCSARAVVAEAYKREPEPKQAHHWKDTAGVRFDARTLTFDLTREFATLSTTGGRVRVGLRFGDYQRQYLDASWTFAKTGTLIKRRGKWYLCLVAEKEVPDSDGTEVLAYDAGINRIATTSTGKVFAGSSIKQLRKRRFKQRRSLKVGHNRSRNKRRLLQRLTKKEHRAVEWLLWNVANEIVREALRIGASTIAAEDLTHIRLRIRVAKKQRVIQHGWPFASLLAKIKHVASRHGIRVVEVDARGTSRTCNRCGYEDKRNRKSQSDFKCLSCGHNLMADFHASFNIRDRCVDHVCGVRKPSPKVRRLRHQVATLQG